MEKLLKLPCYCDCQQPRSSCDALAPCYSSFASESPMTQAPALPKAPSKPEAVNLDIYQAILAASAEFGPLTKDAANSYLKSSYLSLPALLKAVREPLSDQGVVITAALCRSVHSS